MASSVESSWFVWITALSSAYAEALVGRIVAKGWHVSALGDALVIGGQGSLAIIGIKMTITGKTPVTKEQALSMLSESMDGLGMVWVGVVITEPCDSRWMSNVLPYAEPGERRNGMGPQKTTLRLVPKE